MCHKSRTRCCLIWDIQLHVHDRGFRFVTITHTTHAQHNTPFSLIRSKKIEQPTPPSSPATWTESWLIWGVQLHVNDRDFRFVTITHNTYLKQCSFSLIRNKIKQPTPPSSPATWTGKLISMRRALHVNDRDFRFVTGDYWQHKLADDTFGMQIQKLFPRTAMPRQTTMCVSHNNVPRLF